MNENPKGSRIANPATGLRALMECGEFSPLSAGDSSPSEFGSFRSAGRLLRWREPKRPRFTAHLDDLDGDKSPAESGDKSPHSKTRRANAGRRRTRMSFSLAPGFSRVSARQTSGSRFNGFKAVALSLGCAVLTLGSWGACADSKSAADAKAELAKLEQELRRLRAGIHAGQSNAVAASVKACPDGHKTLMNVRISYGTPSFAPEHQKAREEAIARFEYWPGGCVVGQDSPTNRVTCTTCGLGLDSQFGFWSAYRPAPSQFRRPFSAPILGFPIPATNTVLSGPTYYQTIHKGQKQQESLSYTTREPKEQVVKSVDAWFGKQGLTPTKRVQSNPGSGPTSDLVNWEAERLSVQLKYFGNEGTTAVYISNQLASYP